MFSLSGWTKFRQIEWPTLCMLGLCYAIYALATIYLPEVSMGLAIAGTALAVALHSSLSHEILHGHPFKSQSLNEALVFPALGLFIPYQRFKATHLAHHSDVHLTDPYDDPESNYLDPVVWNTLAPWQQFFLRMNNSMAGRLLFGPLIGQIRFMRQELKAMLNGDRTVVFAWVVHVPATLTVIFWLNFLSDMPLWAYLIGVYLALSILKIRTFLEHQSHRLARGRSVIVEDYGPLGWLFLFNSLHIVHHMHPRVPWYHLPKLYRANPARYLKMNEGYYFVSYWQIFKKYALRSKDPVAHPLWPKT